MDRLVELLTPFGWGLCLGAAYFTVLWLVTLRLGRSRQPALLLVGSAGLRIAILLFGFYVFMDGDWQRLLACVVGFIVARLIAIYLVRLLGGERPRHLGHKGRT